MSDKKHIIDSIASIARELGVRALALGIHCTLWNLGVFRDAMLRVLE